MLCIFGFWKHVANRMPLHYEPVMWSGVFPLGMYAVASARLDGELIATDGDLEIRAPCDDCTIFMPARKAIVGREGVYLTRPMA